MKTATISDAKNHLSAYIDLVRQGETVVILDRKKPVARLTPIDPATDLDDEARLTELERKGVLRRAKVRPSRTFLKSLPPAPKIKGDLLAILIAERGEGR
ncbi:MAG: type II toxin-antitoxin system prevent-host-death family antitoxin [Casimicrobiaceae bacterium]